MTLKLPSLNLDYSPSADTMSAIGSEAAPAVGSAVSGASNLLTGISTASAFLPGVGTIISGVSALANVGLQLYGQSQANKAAAAANKIKQQEWGAEMDQKNTQITDQNDVQQNQLRQNDVNTLLQKVNSEPALKNNFISIFGGAK